MTPNELYKREPEQTVSFIETDWDGSYVRGCYYNHIPEIDGYTKYKPTDRIQIRIYKFVLFDHRRFWRLASFWLDDKPVMIIRNAGREGDDHADRFITNYELYVELVSLLLTLQIPEEIEHSDIIDPDSEHNITWFYGQDLEDETTN